MKSKKNIIILILVIAISLFGITYAFFDYYNLGANQEIISGRVSLLLKEGTDTINISNVFPESVEKARKRTDNKITFTITGHNTTLDKDIWYEIMLNEGDSETGLTRFNPYDLCFDLAEIDGENKVYIFEQMRFEDFNEKRIWVNTVDRKTENDISKTYELRMWLSEDVIVSDTNPNRDYPATGFENYYASVKVSVFGDFKEKEVSYQPNYLARVSEMQMWPNEIMNEVQTISKVKFVAMGQTEMETRYNAASVKADVTASDDNVQQTGMSQLSVKAQTIENAKGGKVYAWLEADIDNEGFNTLYVVSDGITYFPSDSSLMFMGLAGVNEILFENINTSQVTDMGGMFFYCSGVSDLNLKRFDTSNVTTFTKVMVAPDGSTMNIGMFEGCGLLNRVNMNGWDTSKVTNMANMFSNCVSLVNLDLSFFNTGSVIDMSKMFYYCYSLTNINLRGFNTSSVTNMSSMFSWCEKLTNLSLNHFDTSSVIDMNNMFSYCKDVTSIILSSWNTSNVTDMSFMFHECNELSSLDVSKFNTGSVTTTISMFKGCVSLTEINVSNWDTSNVVNMGGMFGESTDYADDGATTIGGLIVKELDVSNWDTSNVTDMYSLFSGCMNITKLDVSNWNTSSVTDINSIFAGCSSLVSLDLSKWNTSLIEDISSAFSGCTSLKTLNLNNWNTSNVTNMSSVFYQCSSLTDLNLKSFNTSNVIRMSQMFDGCTSLKILDISNFTFDGVDGNVSFIFRGMTDDSKVTVGSTTVRDYILALGTPNDRPTAWTTENFVIGS